jgi:hypothetical protein
MMMDFSQPSYFQIFILALIYFLILGGVLLYFIFTKRINWVIAWLLPMISLFLGFKSSFVRADGHVYHFLSLIFLSALYFYYLVEFNKTEKMDLPWVQTLAKAFIPFLAVIVYSAYSFLGGKFDVKNDFLGIKELIKSGPTARESYRTLARNRIQEIYDIDPEFLRQIDPAKSIDIIPWDIALLYGYEFKWTPRPVIQSYASYTSKLDLIDAGFFRSVNAPEQLIISLYTIDQRYIIFDTPATFQTLLDTYEYKYHSSDGRYALFVKKPILTLRDTISLSRDQYGFFERIPIPKVSNSHVYLSVEIEPTLSGKIMNFLYKPSEFKVEINLESGEKRVYRFIRDTGKNGLFVSIHVENLNDLAKVFEENYDQNITSISILGDSLFYKEPFNVHFYSVPFFNE